MGKLVPLVALQMLDVVFKILLGIGMAWLAFRIVYSCRPPEPNYNRFTRERKERMPKPTSGVIYLFRLARASEPSRTGSKGAVVEELSAERTVGWEAMDIARKPPLLRRCQGGYYGVPGLDDVCLHLSTMSQVTETARLYFKGIDDLLLLKFSTEGIENDEACELRWEAALPQKGAAPRQDVFPHVYSAERGAKAKLSWLDLAECITLPLGADGQHIFPLGWDSEEEVAAPVWPGAVAKVPLVRDVKAEELNALEEQLRREMLEQS